MKKYTVNFTRGEQIAGNAGEFISLKAAEFFASMEASHYKGHPDFKGGFFEVWEHGPDGDSFCENIFWVAK